MNLIFRNFRGPKKQIPVFPFFALLVAIGITACSAAAPALIFNDTPPVSATADGGLRSVVGVHNIQVVRANRTAPPHANALAHTYLHAPMLAWWHGQFYLDYLSAPVNEHDAPTVTSYTTSPDGVTWPTTHPLFLA